MYENSTFRRGNKVKGDWCGPSLVNGTLVREEAHLAMQKDGCDTDRSQDTGKTRPPRAREGKETSPLAFRNIEQAP